MPHPSGLAFDPSRGVVHVASTRNPNQLVDLAPATGLLERLDVGTQSAEPLLESRPLIPMRTRTFPGCFYLHDLALVGGVLHGNSVGQNAVVKLADDGPEELAWWPRCVERRGKPVTAQNHIQLNSIAAGPDLARSYFSASADRLSTRRPGHRNFPVDGWGVVFDGTSREPVIRGLTRPHSARLHRGRLWVDNSGYGELGIGDVRTGSFDAVVRLPGWTRGLGFIGDIAFVGTSKVIPRFRGYAPGLDVARSVCGVHAVDTRSGQVLGSFVWPYGNQIFAIELVPSRFSAGFLSPVAGKRAGDAERVLLYAFQTISRSKRRTRRNP